MTITSNLYFNRIEKSNRDYIICDVMQSICFEVWRKEQWNNNVEICVCTKPVERKSKDEKFTEIILSQKNDTV